MDDETCELRQIKNDEERVLRTGLWDEHIARINLPTTPNGVFAVVSTTRRLVLSKTGNQGPGGNPGRLKIIEDAAVQEPADTHERTDRTEAPESSSDEPEPASDQVGDRRWTTRKSGGRYILEDATKAYQDIGAITGDEIAGYSAFDVNGRFLGTEKRFNNARELVVEEYKRQE